MHLKEIVLINFIEMLVLCYLFCMKLEKRPGMLWKTALVFVPILLYAFFAPLASMRMLFHMPILVMSFLFVVWCYQVSFRRGLFVWLAAYAVQRIGSMVNSIAMYFLPARVGHYGNDDYDMLLAGFALIIGLDILTYVLAYVLMIRRVTAVDINRNASRRVVFLTGIVLILNQLWSLGAEKIGDGYATDVTSLIEYLWALAASVLCLIVQFGLLETAEKDQELEITRHLIEEQEQQYKMSKSNIESINRKCHDLKHLGMAAQQSDDARKNYLSEAMAIVDSFDSSVHTGNETLDVIFTEKNQYCKNHQIDFVCMIDGKQLDFMEAVDLYVLFGNIIDNAIGAVRKLEDYGRRTIYIDVHRQQNLLLIRTENPFDGELSFKNGVPLTTTGDTFNHGYGMSSIRLIAEKYKGSANARAVDGVFYLSVVIPLGIEGEER